MSRRGFTLIEVMVVIVIGSMLLIPMVNFFIGSRKISYKGYDRLENLNTARLLIEKCSRDLKFLCGTASFPGILTEGAGDGKSYVFLAFPDEGGGVDLKAAENPVNLIAYTFDPAKRTVRRTVITHPMMVGGNSPIRTQEIGNNVIGFEIGQWFLWGRFYNIRVKCVGPHPQREEYIELQTSVRSVFEARALNHLFQIPNLSAEPIMPKR